MLVIQGNSDKLFDISKGVDKNSCCLQRVEYYRVAKMDKLGWEAGEGNGNPLLCSCLENPRDGGAWWPAVYGVTQSRTRLK